MRRSIAVQMRQQDGGFHQPGCRHHPSPRRVSRNPGRFWINPGSIGPERWALSSTGPWAARR